MTSQFQVLNKILMTKDFSIVTLNNLTEDYFFNYKAEFLFIKAHYETYKTIPDRLTFLNSFPDFDIQDINEPDSYLIEQLFKDYNSAYLATNFNSVKKYIENGEDDKAVDCYVHAVEGLRRGAALTCTDLMKDTSRYDRFLERSTNWNKYYISTGFPELDKLTGGIDRENENMVIAARTGIGKTWTLLKMVVAASIQGLNVGLYSGEMSADKVGYRIDTLMGHIKNSSIARGDLYIQQDYKKFIDSLPASNYGGIKVVTPLDIAGPATVDVLRAFIEKYNLDILFVDQYSLLEDSSKARVAHERVANISKAIKNLQVMTKIPIISVSQMNRTKNEDGSQDTTQIGLSDRIGQDATSIIMLDRKEDLLILNIVKARDGGDNKKLTYKVDLNMGTFYYMPAEGDNISTEEDLANIANSYNIDSEAQVF